MIKTNIDVPDTNGERIIYTLETSIVNNNARFAPNQAFTFTSHEVLSRNHAETRVFKGELVDRTSTPYPRPVVCKLVRGDTSSLAEEAKLYTTTLARKQGGAVPAFIFYCVGTAPDSDVPVAAMFLPYYGRALSGEWLDHPVTFRFRVWLLLLDLHRMGVCHGDFRPANVVVDDAGRPRIIDFGESDSHKCDVAAREFFLFEDRPERRELACDELYEASLDMDLWTPTVHCFMGVPIDLRVVHSADEIVDKVLERQPQYADAAGEVADRANKYMDAFNKHYVVRRRKGAKRQAAIDKAREEGIELPRKVYIPPLPSPSIPRQKIYRKINRARVVSRNP